MSESGLRPLVAGNWKMNGLLASKAELDRILQGIGRGECGRAEMVICPPFTLIVPFSQYAKGSGLGIGAQDCHPRPSGAHTGDIAAAMLVDAGATYIIVGHSERRTDHGEGDALVQAKAEAVLKAGARAILCVGETRAEREAGKTLDVVASQLAGSMPPGADAQSLVVAYEPVWAIGTGLTPTAADVKAVHGFLRDRLGQVLGKAGLSVRILYGGSVKPANAAELMAIENVNGALVGGASLKAADFLGIAAAYR